MSPHKRLDGVYKARPRQQHHHHAAVIPVPAPPRKRTGGRRLARFGNTLVMYGLVGAGIYAVGAPYVPSLFSPPTISAERSAGSAFNAPVPPEAADEVPYFGKNTLTIPQIGVDSEILEGVDEKTLERGLWRRPRSSTPELGGNTVIAAHRFKYTTGPNTFYYLDKLKIGDVVSLTWKGTLYRYQVENIQIVSANEVGVEENTLDSRLTLYTCTPLWSSEKRLVVQAKLLP